jgi:hypothetical protein
LHCIALLASRLQDVPHHNTQASITFIPDVFAVVPCGTLKITSMFVLWRLALDDRRLIGSSALGVEASGSLINDRVELLFQLFEGDKKVIKSVDINKCEVLQMENRAKWSATSSALLSSTIAHEANGFTPYITLLFVKRSQVLGCAMARIRDFTEPTLTLKGYRCVAHVK